jgi:NADH dehydrogenase [ubiquinone] 1 alpha subcomplex assembly factor 6
MLKNLRAGKDVGHEFEHEGEGHEYGRGSQHSTIHGDDDGTPNLTLQLKEVERGFGVLMAAVPTSQWLDKLQKVDFDIFKPELRTTDWRLPWKAYWVFQQKVF